MRLSAGFFRIFLGLFLFRKGYYGLLTLLTNVLQRGFETK
ncbi:hypothetical protein CHCC20335_3196 [Bacillus paralicheniformis]|nr:hypothetical protein CHCC20335_3196 [Bacillus paralicheniformis]